MNVRGMHLLMSMNASRLAARERLSSTGIVLNIVFLHSGVIVSKQARFLGFETKRTKQDVRSAIPRTQKPFTGVISLQRVAECYSFIHSFIE